MCTLYNRNIRISSDYVWVEALKGIKDYSNCYPLKDSERRGLFLDYTDIYLYQSERCAKF